MELVTRAGCHLCDVARALLAAEARLRPLAVDLVDVDGDPELLRLYDLRVPVVRVGGRELCEGVITPLGLRAALEAA